MIEMYLQHVADYSIWARGSMKSNVWVPWLQLRTSLPGGDGSGARGSIIFRMKVVEDCRGMRR